MGQETETTNDAQPTQGYFLADDALERLERLVGVISEPLVVFTSQLAGERDDARVALEEARALNNRLTKALADLVAEWPQTSWLAVAYDTATALLDEVAGEGATMGTSDPATHSGEPPHGPSHGTDQARH